MVLLTGALALGLLVSAAAERPRPEAQVLGRGAALERRQEFSQAKQLYLDGLARFPRSGELAYRLGLLYLREGQWAEAIRHLEAAQKARPRHVDGLYYLAQAYFLHGEHRRAHETLERAAALAPQDAAVAQKRGEYLCEDDLCRDGLPHLERARRLDPTLENIDFDLGMAHHRLAHVPEAQRHLEAALARDPGNLVAARFLADTLGHQEQWERALALYQQVVDREPGNAWALYGLGRARVGLQRYQDALAPLRAALEADPSIAEAHYQLGMALRRLGRREEALRELALFKALRERAPGRAPSVTAERTPAEERVWQTCIRLLTEGKEAEALAYLEALPADRPPNAPYLLGALYLGLGRAREAVAMLARAAERAPADADVLAFLGRAHLAAGQPQAAEPVLKRAAALEPGGELPLLALGELEYARGNWASAVRYLEQSKTSQVPALLKLCRAALLLGDRDKAEEAAALVRAFGSGDVASLREVDALLSAAPPAGAPSPRP